MYHSDRFQIDIQEAKKKLKEICNSKAVKLYGTDLPEVVKNRLELELSAIVKNHFESQYLLGALLAEQSKSAGFSVTTRGTIGSSFVAYLCGITNVNPLPAHRYCPHCHHFELASEKNNYRVMGYDLPVKDCPKCGARLVASGADIQPVIAMGLNLDQAPALILNVAREIRADLINYLKTLFGEDSVFRAGVKVEREDGFVNRGVHPGRLFIVPKEADISEVTALREPDPTDESNLPITEEDYIKLDGILFGIDLLTLPELSFLHFLEEETGINSDSDQIRYDDPLIMKSFVEDELLLLPENTREEIAPQIANTAKEYRPKCFSDFVRLSMMIYAPWKESKDSTVNTGKQLAESITSRDDIFQYLLEKGLDKEAAYSAFRSKEISKELKHTLKSSGVEDGFIQFLEEKEYLFPKSHATEYTILAWKLAYYRLYHPEAYVERRIISIENSLHQPQEFVMMEHEHHVVLQAYCSKDVERVDNIPAAINGKPVTTVDVQAFVMHKEIRELILPDSITDIEAHAFRDCTGLKRIVLPRNLKNLHPCAFSFCYLNNAEIVLPEGWEDIEVSDRFITGEYSLKKRS